MKLVLGSTSPFRKSLLERLHLDFECASPDIDESPVDGESIEDMVKRLSELKAEAVAAQYADDDTSTQGSRSGVPRDRRVGGVRGVSEGERYSIL